MQNGLFGIPVQKGEISRADEFITNLATRLVDAIKAHGKIYGNIHYARAANQMMRLNEKDKVSRERIAAAVSFYEKNIGKEFVPAIFSANSFRKKFLSLELAMTRPSTPDRPHKIKITDDARQIQKSAGFLIWDTDAEKLAELPFIQITFDRYSEFLDKLGNLVGRLRIEAEQNARIQTEKSGEVKSTVWEKYRLVHRIYVISPPAEEFTLDWLRRTHRLTDWAGWKADLLAWVWTTRHKRYAQSMRDAIAAYGDDPAKWDKILSEIEGDRPPPGR